MSDRATHTPGSTPKASQPLANGQHAEIVADNSNIGDEVMDILCDVEKQLNRLRSAKRDQDVELASLAQRAAAMDKAEADLAQQHATLQQEQHALESLERELTSQQQSFASERDEVLRDLEAQRVQLRQQQESVQSARAKVESGEAELATQRQSIERRADELAEAEQRFHSERQQLETARVSLQQTVAQSETRISELTRQLDQAHASLQARTADCDAAQRSAAQLRDQIETLESSLKQAADRMEQVQADAIEMSASIEQERDSARADAQAKQTRLAEAEQQIRTLHTAMESLSNQLAETRKQLEASRTAEQYSAAACAQHEQSLAQTQQQRDTAVAKAAAMTQRAEAAEAQVRSSESCIEDLRSQLTNLQSKLEEAAGRVASLEAQLKQRESQLAEAQKKLKLAGERIAKFGEAIHEQAEQLERGAAALATVEQQQRTIERLTSELAQARASGDLESVKRKDERIRELTEALRQARGQTVGSPDLQAMEHRITEQEWELHQLRLKLETANVEVTKAEEALEEARQAADRSKSDSGSLEHVQRLTAEVARLESALLSAQKSDQTESLQHKVAELELLLDKAREAATRSTQNEASTEPDREVQEKAQRVARVAKHLQRRYQRLQAMRRAMRRRGIKAPPAAAPHQRAAGQSMLEEHTSHMRQLEKRRRELIELKAMLAESEKKMIRRWARPRAVAIIAWVVIMTGIVGAGSWVAADHFFPATVNAFVNLEATGRKSGPVSEIHAQQWSQWHQQLLENSAFHQVIANRMRERRNDALATPEAVQQYIAEYLGVDASQKGRIRLTLSGTSEAAAVSNLDVITSSLVMESARQLSARDGDIWAGAPAARNDNGEVKYASLDPIPLHDNRLTFAVVIFAVSYVLALGLAWLVYTRLLRSKRVFDEETLAADSFNTAMLAGA